MKYPEYTKSKVYVKEVILTPDKNGYGDFKITKVTRPTKSYMKYLRDKAQAELLDEINFQKMKIKEYTERWGEPDPIDIDNLAYLIDKYNRM